MVAGSVRGLLLPPLPLLLVLPAAAGGGARPGVAPQPPLKGSRLPWPTHACVQDSIVQRLAEMEAEGEGAAAEGGKEAA